jgi:hypothetical protein
MGSACLICTFIRLLPDITDLIDSLKTLYKRAKTQKEFTNTNDLIVQLDQIYAQGGPKLKYAFADAVAPTFESTYRSCRRAMTAQQCQLDTGTRRAQPTLSRRLQQAAFFYYKPVSSPHALPSVNIVATLR